MIKDCDVCIIGSGAGGSPIAFELASAGYSVIVLEKGPWFKENDFAKDELVAVRRSVYTPSLKQEFHVLETGKENNWKAQSTLDSGRNFWNGNCVGGSSNFMSGYFHRLKPEDFRLLSEFGAISGANIADWPISYQDLEPYYAKVEKIVGISGRIIAHPFQEPRSTPDFPFPPLQENYVSKIIDDTCAQLNFNSVPVARAILSQPHNNRASCYYSNFCGSYGCHSGAKGSARAALLDLAVKTGKCEIRPHSFVYHLTSDNQGKVNLVKYYDREGQTRQVSAQIFVVACQAIETSRLLLMSTGSKHPEGLANHNGQLGKNLIFSAGATGNGTIRLSDYPEDIAQQLKLPGLFVNRSLQDWYIANDSSLGGRVKGGLIDFLFDHANPIRRANSLKWEGDQLLWGEALQNRLQAGFTNERQLNFEVFNDWLPTDNCFVALDPTNKDKWQNPVAKVRLGYHQHDLKIAKFLGEKAKSVLEAMKLKNITTSVSGAPPANLVAGGCRFGVDPDKHILDPDCRAYSASNLFVADASFMPTGGSVPYTWTIYANSFRVADKIKAQL